MARVKDNNPQLTVLENILNEYLSEIGDQNSLTELFSRLIEILMKKEREFHLSNDEGNKGNGYYNRNLACLFGNLNLQVPRDRKGNFRSSFLPAIYEKADESFNEFILNLVLSSYSPNKIKSLLKSMDIPYSPEQIEEMKEELHKKAKELSTKQLPEDVFSLFIDAYHTQVKDDDTNQVKKAVIYTILGIDMIGKILVKQNFINLSLTKTAPFFTGNLVEATIVLLASKGVKHATCLAPLVGSQFFTKKLNFLYKKIWILPVLILKKTSNFLFFDL